MHRHAPRLAVRLGKHQRFFAEHEDGGAAEKMRGDDHGAARGDRAGAVDDGDGVAAGVGHGACQRLDPLTPERKIKQRSSRSLR